MFGKKPDHILVIKTDGLAGFVAAEPAFEALRAAHPGARISLLTTPDLQRVAKACPYFDQIAAMPSAREPEARKVFIRQLKAEKFSRVYDLASDVDSRRIEAAFGPFRPRWYSATAAKQGAAARTLEAQTPSLSRLYSAAGLEAPTRLPDFSWAISARKDSANMQPSWFGISGPFGLLMPAADERLRWPANEYAAFARVMSRAGVAPVVIGAKSAHAVADAIAHEAPEVVDLTGKTDLLQVAALGHEASFFVSDEAEEVHLVLGAGCAGVLVKRRGRVQTSPAGRHLVTLTVGPDGAEPAPEFVWRTLENMQLTPEKQTEARPLMAAQR